MSLSVPTSSIDSNLAALLLGGLAPATATPQAGPTAPGGFDRLLADSESDAAATVTADAGENEEADSAVPLYPEMAFTVSPPAWPQSLPLTSQLPVEERSAATTAADVASGASLDGDARRSPLGGQAATTSPALLARPHRFSPDRTAEPRPGGTRAQANDDVAQERTPPMLSQEAVSRLPINAEAGFGAPQRSGGERAASGPVEGHQRAAHLSIGAQLPESTSGAHLGAIVPNREAVPFEPSPGAKGQPPIAAAAFDDVVLSPEPKGQTSFEAPAIAQEMVSVPLRPVNRPALAPRATEENLETVETALGSPATTVESRGSSPWLAQAAVSGQGMRPLTREFSRPEDRAAKIASGIVPPTVSEAPASSVPTKTFVTAGEASLATRRPTVGTPVANSDSAMPSASIPSPTTSAEPDSAGVVAFGETALMEAVASTDLAPAEATHLAHSAVAAALKAADRFAAGERQSVNLHFSVGGSDLSVRVELRANEIHATFRTDSAELRAALSHEWQSTVASAPERALRIADPVFATAGGTNSSSFSGDGASRQRDPGTQQAGAEFAIAGPRARASQTNTTAAAPAAASPSRAPGGTARHLSTLA